MSTLVPGDPASCHDAAAALRRVATRTAEGGDLARAGSRTPARSFSGITADAYRSRCANVLLTADGLARRSREGAEALDAYGDDLAAVQGVMERVRASARGHGLLSGWALVLPDAPTPVQEQAHHRLVVIAGNATTYLGRVRSRLVDAFTVDLPAPTTTDYGTVLLPPEEPVVGPVAFPPPESAWPDDAAGPGGRGPRDLRDPLAPWRDPQDRQPDGGTGDPVHPDRSDKSSDGADAGGVDFPHRSAPGVLDGGPRDPGVDWGRVPWAPGGSDAAQLPGWLSLPGADRLP